MPLRGSSVTSFLNLAWNVAARRALANWGLELALFLGILMAISLVSSSLAFSDLLAEAALRNALDDAPYEDTNISARTFYGLDNSSGDPLVENDYATALYVMQTEVAYRFLPYLADEARLLQTSTFYFAGHPHLGIDSPERPRGKVQHMTGMLPDRVDIVQGRWPYEEGASAPSLDLRELEVAVDVQGLEFLQLDVGQTMEIFPATTVDQADRVRVHIVGAFRRVDPEDEFWYGANRAFSFDNDEWKTTPMFTTEDALLTVLGREYPDLYSQVTWFFYLDRHGVRTADLDGIKAAIRGAEHGMRSGLSNGSASTRLATVIEDYDEQLLLARVPLFLMVFLVNGILMYYLALAAGLLLKTRAVEISMLKSRGSTTPQLGLLSAFEGMLLAVPAIIIGPFLALLLARVLGALFFDFGPVNDLIPLFPSGLSFLAGAIGGLIAIAVLTIATVVGSRQSIVDYRQTGARPPTTPFLQRYYLDIALLAVIGLLWWQIQARGAFLVRPVGGGLELDYSLLLGPALGLVALGLVVMRLFPLVMRALAALSAPVAPPWLTQGLRRVSRDPVVPGALVVLVALATALGVIGSSFSSTLERSQVERAMYEVGADVRVRHSGDNLPLSEHHLSTAMPDDAVTSGAEVHRTAGHLLSQGLNTTRLSLLAVDAPSFSETAWYRPDFANGQTMGQILGGIGPDGMTGAGGDGLELPADTEGLAVWLRTDRRISFGSLRARLKDSRGYHFDIDLGTLNRTGWQQLDGEMTPIPQTRRFRRQVSPPPPVYPPFTLLAVHISSLRGFGEPGAIFIDRLEAVSPAGRTMVADGRSLASWQTLEDYARPGLYQLDYIDSISQRGSGGSAAFTWSVGGAGLKGIRAGPSERPLRALVSPSFLEEAGGNQGEVFKVGLSQFAIELEAVAVADFFPTLEDPRHRPFAVVDRQAFIQYANAHAPRPVGGANELWLQLADANQDMEFVAPTLREKGLLSRGTMVASEAVSKRVDTPLISAGWKGLIVLMFLALVVAGVSGIVLFCYIDTQERRTELAVLRTLGFSKAQLNVAVWFSLLVVVVFGMGLGTWVGQLIGSSILPLLEVAEEGARVTPPMILQTDWTTLLVSYAILVGAALASFLWLSWLTARLDVQRVLRMGEA